MHDHLDCCFYRFFFSDPAHSFLRGSGHTHAGALHAKNFGSGHTHAKMLIPMPARSLMHASGGIRMPGRCMPNILPRGIPMPACTAWILIPMPRKLWSCDSSTNPQFGAVRTHNCVLRDHIRIVLNNINWILWIISPSFRVGQEEIPTFLSNISLSGKHNLLF